MKAKLLAFTLFVAATTDGFASLWDTFDQCVAKYGKPIHVSDDVIKMSGDPGPGVEPVDVEIGNVDALAAKYPQVADDLRTFPVPVKE